MFVPPLQAKQQYKLWGIEKALEPRDGPISGARPLTADPGNLGVGAKARLKQSSGPSGWRLTLSIWCLLREHCWRAVERLNQEV